MTNNKTIRARVTVFPRPEILDPQGKAIGKALARLGFDNVREVRAGKSFDIELGGVDDAEARQLLAQMSEQLLANPIVEDFNVEWVAGRASGIEMEGRASGATETS